MMPNHSPTVNKQLLKNIKFTFFSFFWWPQNDQWWYPNISPTWPNNFEKKCFSIMCYHKISYLIIWYHIIWYHIIWHHIIWYHKVCDDSIWYDTIWYDIIWYQIIWYHMIWYHAICCQNGQNWSKIVEFNQNGLQNEDFWLLRSCLGSVFYFKSI